jgi:MFS family permease
MPVAPARQECEPAGLAPGCARLAFPLYRARRFPGRAVHATLTVSAACDRDVHMNPLQGALRSPASLVALVCTAQVLAQIGAYTWPALLPGFLARWPMDNAEAGWVTGIFYAAYMLSVPVLVGLTDRVEPRRIYLLGVALTTLSHAAFALLAEGFWSALALRALAGVGWAGTYMTGLKMLADRVDDTLMSRAVAGHAASIGVAGALSFAVAGSLESLLGWQGAFAVAAACAGAAMCIALVLVPAQRARSPSAPRAGWLPDFRPVLANRAALAYSIAYCVHTWEMSVLRGWAVAFLAFVAGGAGGAPGWLAPVTVATVMGLLGTGASVFGNELAIRFGRARLVRGAMLASAVMAALMGAAGGLTYELAAVCVAFYAMLIWLDSSALTAGAVGNAPPGRRGATLALHSMLGYAGGFLGPVVMGWLLDATGGMSLRGWTVGFLHLTLAGLLARALFTGLRPGSLSGDRAG